MRPSMHLKPGRKGIKQLLAQYGDRLVYVRYRHDAQQKKRFKMVDLIIAEWAWEPPVPQIPADQIVARRIGCAEVGLRERVNVLTNFADPVSTPQVQKLEQAARVIGVQLLIRDVETPEELPAAFNTAASVL